MLKLNIYKLGEIDTKIYPQHISFWEKFAWTPFMGTVSLFVSSQHATVMTHNVGKNVPKNRLYLKSLMYHDKFG